MIPRLVERAGPTATMRVWAPGCATGEEAYSLAILLREEHAPARTSRRACRSSPATSTTRRWRSRAGARYPEGDRRADHARAAGALLRQAGAHLRGRQGDPRDVHLLDAQPDPRPAVLAAGPDRLPQPADLPGEPSCRSTCSTLFHYALRPGGYLFLGPPRASRARRSCSARSTRSTGSSSATRPWRARRSRSRCRQRDAAGPAGPTGRRALADAGPAGAWWPELERSSWTLPPAWVVVNAQGEVVYFSPRTGRYLEPAAGTPTMDILSMARKGLRLDLRTALHKAVKTRRGGHPRERRGRDRRPASSAST